MDGNGRLFEVVQGNKISLLLIYKYDRWTRSYNRLARIKTERRHNYLRNIAEAITGRYYPKFIWLILVRSADFKTDLN